MGDRVIKKVGDILVAAIKKWDQSTIGFAGHIGRARKAFHTDDELQNGT